MFCLVEKMFISFGASGYDSVSIYIGALVLRSFGTMNLITDFVRIVENEYKNLLIMFSWYLLRITKPNVGLAMQY